MFYALIVSWRHCVVSSHSMDRYVILRAWLRSQNVPGDGDIQVLKSSRTNISQARLSCQNLQLIFSICTVTFTIVLLLMWILFSFCEGERISTNNWGIFVCTIKMMPLGEMVTVSGIKQALAMRGALSIAPLVGFQFLWATKI